MSNPGTCRAACVDDQLQTACVSGDGCCPAGCNAANDKDCVAKCGNDAVESGTLGEQRVQQHQVTTGAG